MNTNIRRTAGLCAAAVPAAGLALVAGFSQSLYASSSCFDPQLQLFSQISPATVMTTGDAQAKLLPKPPFILEGATSATGYLDSDGGATGSNALGSVSRFWTPTCTGWSYGWAARGTVVGELKAKTSKTWPGSATASCAFTATASGDLSPAVHGAELAASATQGGGSVSMSLGVAPPSVSYSIGQTTTMQTVSPSTNPAGDSKTIFGGPQTNVGAGAESVVVVNLSQSHSSSALGGMGGTSWAPHIRKSQASTGGYAGAAITQDLFALSPEGLSFGISVHPQTCCYRWAHRDKEYGGGIEYGPWKPPFGPEFEESGPTIEWVDEPPPQPDEEGRTKNDGPFHKAD
jgi:hypothetical protein